MVFISMLPSTVAAQEATLRAGFRQHGRVGQWLPVSADWKGLTPLTHYQFHVAAPDPRGDRCESLVAEGTSDAKGELSLQGVFVCGRLQGDLHLWLAEASTTPSTSNSVVWQVRGECRDSDDAVTESPAPTPDLQLTLVRHQPLMVLTVGKPAGLEKLIERFQAEEEKREALYWMTVDAVADLPESRRAYDAVDVLILSGDQSLSERQLIAVRDWTMTGGHLIVTAGKTLPSFLSTPAGPWIAPLFGIPDESPTLETLDLSPLQNFVTGATALQTNRNPVTVARMNSIQPRILAPSINGPLVSRTATGAGIISFVAVDLNLPPVSGWLSLSQFYEVLLFDHLLESRDESHRSGNMISSAGVTDITSQLIAAADAIPGDQHWSTWNVMLLIVVVLVLAGPVDYLLVVKLLRRPRLTWLTLPLILVASSLIPLLAGPSVTKETISRSIGVLDVMPQGSTELIRSRVYSSLSTVQSQYATVEQDDADWLRQKRTERHESSLRWSGRPEDVYGGMYRSGGAGLGQHISRRIDSEPRYTAVPMLPRGAQEFLYESLDELPSSTLVTSELQLPGSGLLEGTFQHHLPVPISNWTIVCQNRVYVPLEKATETERMLPPGQSWSRRSGRVRIVEIRDFLRGIRLLNEGVVRKDFKSLVTQVQTPYDVNSKDPFGILLMTSLYHSSGGQQFVKLQNSASRRDEVSDSVQLNCALLIGSVDLDLTTGRMNNESLKDDAAGTVVRIFLPVERTEYRGEFANPKEE